MASSFLSLSDLINYQLERLKLDEFVYKDELQLQRQLADLDAEGQYQQHQQQLQRRQFYKQQQSHQYQQQQQTPQSQSLSQHRAPRQKLHHQKHQYQQTKAKSPPPQPTSSSAPASTSTSSSQQLQQQHYAAVQQYADAQLEEVIASNGAGATKTTATMTMTPATSSGRLAARQTSASSDEEVGAVGGGGGGGGGTATGTGTATATATGTAANSATSSECGGVVSGATDLQKEFKVQVLEWFQQLRDQSDDFKSDEESRRLREAGNDSYRKERHPLKACDFFTEAIFRASASDERSLAAAVAHANRSTVLHDCGMFQQSYDDCLCALELGYPEEYWPLIKLRQASCALKLRNFTLCELHLHELLHMELTEAFEARTHELWHQCETQKSEKFEMGVQTDDELQGNGQQLYEVAWHDSSNIMTTTKGASLRAVAAIAVNAPVFHESATVFVGSGETRICDNCALTQFVPFPCVYCANRAAVYCSRKCRAEHAAIHAVECFAHQIELFEEFAVEYAKPRLLQLALRMLITGLPQVVPHCRKKPTVTKMWAAFNGVLTERTDIAYSALLRLEASYHGDATASASSASATGIVACAVVAHIMAIYLCECTDFFEHLEHTMPMSARLSGSEWELLTAALLLRHIGQLRHKNLIHCPSFVLPADPHVLTPMNEFRLWAGVRRLRRGHLHLLAGDVASVAYAVFPRALSMCRHACAGTLFRSVSGRKLTAYAAYDIAAGDSITHCFSAGNYRQTLYEARREALQARGIDCKCEKCYRPYPDEDFHKFHRYRCDNPKCMQIFTPTLLKRTRNLQWWKSDYYIRPENNGSELLVCSVCEETQKLDWYWTFSAALLDCDAIEERCKLYAAIERADNQLVEMHECKVALARQLVEQCLLMHRDGNGANPLDEWEFNKLGSIMRSALHIVAAQYRVFSIEYVQHMSYFWDVMALSNYKCSDKELMQMLHALEYIPDEFKEIFINYYEDFIAPKFADETYTKLMDTQV